MSPEALSVIYTLIIVFASVVLVLAAIALAYAIGILHNLFKISRFVKEGGEILRRDIFGFLERVFTDQNIKTALTALAVWGAGVFNGLKGKRKTTRKRKPSSKRAGSKKKSE
jgi:hypothetical protein